MDREEMAREIQRMHDENIRSVAEMEQVVADHNRQMADLVLEAQLIVIRAHVETSAMLMARLSQKRTTVAM